MPSIRQYGYEINFEPQNSYGEPRARPYQLMYTWENPPGNIRRENAWNFSEAEIRSLYTVLQKFMVERGQEGSDG